MLFGYILKYTGDQTVDWQKYKKQDHIFCIHGLQLRISVQNANNSIWLLLNLEYFGCGKFKKCWKSGSLFYAQIEK